MIKRIKAIAPFKYHSLLPIVRAKLVFGLKTHWLKEKLDPLLQKESINSRQVSMVIIPCGICPLSPHIFDVIMGGKESTTTADTSSQMKRRGKYSSCWFTVRRKFCLKVLWVSCFWKWEKFPWFNPDSALWE